MVSASFVLHSRIGICILLTHRHQQTANDNKLNTKQLSSRPKNDLKKKTKPVIGYALRYKYHKKTRFPIDEKTVFLFCVNLKRHKGFIPYYIKQKPLMHQNTPEAIYLNYV